MESHLIYIKSCLNNALILPIYTLKQYVHSTAIRSSASLRYSRLAAHVVSAAATLFITSML